MNFITLAEAKIDTKSSNLFRMTFVRDRLDHLCN